MLLFQRCDNIKQIKNEKIVTLSKSVYLFRCIWKSCDGIYKAPELPVNINTFAQSQYKYCHNNWNIEMFI